MLQASVETDFVSLKECCIGECYPVLNCILFCPTKQFTFNMQKMSLKFGVWDIEKKKEADLID